ncbi:MAG: site-2 protease family protein [Acidobacteria bacterium]|nr:site-2 protease family protein [Acidobacteriota bacterium]
MGKIFSGRIAAESALSGPIEIAKYSGEAARRGLKDFLYFIAIISISIGVLNLLPIPVLDGGQMMILGVEGVMRRDLSLRIKEAVNQVGLVLILLIMLTVIFFDVKKSLPGL